MLLLDVHTLFLMEKHYERYFNIADTLHLIIIYRFTQKLRAENSKLHLNDKHRKKEHIDGFLEHF